MMSEGGTIRWLGVPLEKRPRLPDPFEVAHLERVLETVNLSIETDVPLIFSGDVGVGKTTLMRFVDVETLKRDPIPGVSKKSRATWLEEPNWWTTAEDYVADLMAAMDVSRKFDDFGDAYSPSGIARQVKRLFLDDLGVERDTQSGFATEEVGRLIRDRHARNLPTWITTNLTIEEIGARYGERVASRLREQAILVRLSGGDRREAMVSKVRRLKAVGGAG